MKTALAANPNQCTHCPHTVLAIGASFFCPCEDCHVGGLIQGREPKLVSLTEGVTFVRPSTATPSIPVNDEGHGWVDPIHSLD